MNIFAVDVGTSVVKAVEVDPSGVMRGSAASRTRVTSTETGTAEICATDLTQRPLEMLVHAFSDSGLPGNEVSAVAVTSARGTILPCDKHYSPLRLGCCLDR